MSEQKKYPPLRVLKHLDIYPTEKENPTLEDRILQAVKDKRLLIKNPESLYSTLHTEDSFRKLTAEELEKMSILLSILCEAVELMKNERRDRIVTLGHHFPEIMIKCEQMYTLEDGQESLMDVKVVKGFHRNSDHPHVSNLFVYVKPRGEED